MTKTAPQLVGLERFAAFFAPAPNEGAILNECSTFGVLAHSPPNFLAFNNTSLNTSGGSTPVSHADAD